MITSEDKAVTVLMLIELIVIGILSVAIHFELTFGVIEGVLLVIFTEVVVIRELREMKASPVRVESRYRRRTDQR